MPSKWPSQPPFYSSLNRPHRIFVKSTVTTSKVCNAILHLQVANAKFEKITAEVESLKAVLEMKTTEVRTLRNENVRLAEKVLI